MSQLTAINLKNTKNDKRNSTLLILCIVGHKQPHLSPVAACVALPPTPASPVYCDCRPALTILVGQMDKHGKLIMFNPDTMVRLVFLLQPTDSAAPVGDPDK